MWEKNSMITLAMRSSQKRPMSNDQLFISTQINHDKSSYITLAVINDYLGRGRIINGDGLISTKTIVHELSRDDNKEWPKKGLLPSAFLMQSIRSSTRLELQTGPLPNMAQASHMLLHLTAPWSNHCRYTRHIEERFERHWKAQNSY